MAAGGSTSDTSGCGGSAYEGSQMVVAMTGFFVIIGAALVFLGLCWVDITLQQIRRELHEMNEKDRR